MVILKGGSFILRPFKKGDEVSLQKNINNKKIYRYTLNIPYPYTINHARSWIKENLKQQKKKTPEQINWAIVIHNKVVGGIGFAKLYQQNQHHKAELGYWLSQIHWGKGITSKALKMVVAYGFKKLKFKRIYTSVVKPNKASAKVLKKNGFKIEGICKKSILKDGIYHDELIFAKLKRN